MKGLKGMNREELEGKLEDLRTEWAHGDEEEREEIGKNMREVEDELATRPEGQIKYVNSVEEDELAKQVKMFEMVVDLKKRNVEKMKEEIVSYTADIKMEVDRGNYNMAAQYGQKLTELGFKVDTLEKEINEINAQFQYLFNSDIS